MKIIEHTELYKIEMMHFLPEKGVTSLQILFYGII